MNDLEPYKIWVATGILAAVILAGAQLRIRPVASGDAIAQASTLTLDQQSPTPPPSALSAAATDAAQSSDDYVGYGAPPPRHVNWNRVDYPIVQAYAGRSTPVVLNVAAQLVGLPDDYGQGTELNVARQLVGDEAPQAEVLIANDEQVATAFAGDWTVDMTAAVNKSDIFADAPIDNWAYAAIQDNPDFDQTKTSIVTYDDSGLVMLDQARNVR